MPIYTIVCEKCGNETEFLGKFEDQLPNCNKCGNNTTRVCNCTMFKLKYNPKTDSCDWLGNTSQYMREYNKQKAEGKKVSLPE